MAGAADRRAERPRVLAVLLAALAVLLAGAWLYRAALVEQAALAWLKARGLGPAQVAVERVGPDSLRLGPSRFGRNGAVSLRAAEARYALDDLRRGRIDRLTIEGLTLSARLEGGGVAIGGLQSLFPAGAGAPDAPPRLPFRELALEDFRLSLGGPLGPVAVAGDALLRTLPDGGLRLDLAFGLAGEVAGLAGEIRGDLQASIGAGGDVAGTLEVRDAALAHRIGEAPTLRGEARFALASGRLTALTGRLSLASATILGEPVRSAALALDFGGAGLAADAEAAWSGGAGSARLRSATADPTGPARLSGEATVDARWLSGRLAAGLSADGTAALRLAGTLDAPLLALDAAQALDPAALGNFDAEIDLRLREVALPAWAAAGATAGAVRIETRAGALRVAIAEPIRSERVSIAASRPAALPESLRDALSKPLTVELRPSPNAPAAVTLERAPQGAALRARLGAQLRAAGLDLAMDADLALDLGDGLALRRIAPSEVALRLADLRLGAARLTGRAALREVAGAPDALAGAASADLTITGSTGAAELDAAGAFDFDGRRLRFRPADASRVRLRNLSAGAVRTRAPVELRLLPDRESRIAYDLDRGAVEAALALRPGDLSVAIGAGPKPVEARFAAAAAEVALRADGTLRLAVADGRVDLPRYAAQARGVRVEAEWSPDGRHEIALRAAELRHLAAPPAVVPLGLSLQAKGTAARTALRGELADSGRRLVVGIAGEHGFARGAGRATLTLEPITFLPTVLQPPTLFPLAAGHMREVDGRLAASARLEWGPRGLASSGLVDLALQRLETHGAQLRGLVAQVALDGLAPPSTPPGQTARIGRLDLGLPFTDGRIDFELHPDGRVTGRLRELSLFGGSIRTEPFAADPAAARLQLVLKVENVDLEQFLAFAEYGELSATGKLRGTIPVVVTPDDVAIRNAVLATGAGGGQIRYRPRGLAADLESTNDSAALVLRALEQFNYDSIRVEIDENAAGELGMRISLRGSSPNVYDGHPIVLNVALFGALEDVLKQGLRTYRLPGAIGRSLLERQ